MAELPWYLRTGMGEGLQEALYGLGFMSRPAPNLSGAYSADRSTAELERLREEARAREANTYNQVDLHGPDGKSEWVVDPATGQRKLVTQLDPISQQNFNNSRWTLGSAMDFANKMGDGSNYRQRAEDAMYERQMARLRPEWDRREASTQTSLLNRGLDLGDEAYNTGFGLFNNARNDAYSNATLDSIIHGGQEASRLFGIDVGKLNSMIGAAKAADPTRPQSSPINTYQMPRQTAGGPGAVQQALTMWGLQKQEDAGNTDAYQSYLDTIMGLGKTGIGLAAGGGMPTIGSGGFFGGGMGSGYGGMGSGYGGMGR